MKLKKLECGICKKETKKNEILVVPKDKSAGYCLEHFLPSLLNPPPEKRELEIFFQFEEFL